MISWRFKLGMWLLKPFSDRFTEATKNQSKFYYEEALCLTTNLKRRYLLKMSGWCSTCQRCGDLYGASACQGDVTINDEEFHLYKCETCGKQHLLNFSIAPVPLSYRDVFNTDWNEETHPVAPRPIPPPSRIRRECEMP